MYKNVCCTCTVVVLLINLACVAGARNIRELKPKTTVTATASKTSLKKRIRAASNFTALFPPHSIRHFELNSKELYQSSGKETEGRFLVFASSTKREIRQFHVVVVQRRQRKCTKKRTARVKLFCLLNLLVFCGCRCRRSPRCLSPYYLTRVLEVSFFALKKLSQLKGVKENRDQVEMSVLARCPYYRGCP